MIHIPTTTPTTTTITESAAATINAVVHVIRVEEADSTRDFQPAH